MLPTMTESAASSWWPPRGRAADAALSGLITVVVVAWTVLAGQASEVSLGGWLILVLTCGALYFRRSYPLTVTLLTLLGSAVYLLMPDPDGPIVIAFAIAVYTLMATGRFASGVLIGAVVVAASF
jgi:hypothetical protein